MNANSQTDLLGDSLHEELHELVSASLRGELSLVESKRLEKHVLENETARFIYVDEIFSCQTMLTWANEPRETAAEQQSAVDMEDPAKVPSPRSKSWSDRASRRAFPPSIAVAAVVIALPLIWAAVTYVTEQDNKHEPAAEAEFVAWYMGAGCRNGLLKIFGLADLDSGFWACLLWLGLSLGHLV